MKLNLQGDYRDRGPFNVETSRYLILPFQLLKNDKVRMVNLLKAIQTGGSLIGDLFFHWSLSESPAPFMASFQTDDDAEQHYLTRIEPTLRATKCNLPFYKRLKKKRDLYQFPNMNAYFQGSNMSSLQRKSVQHEMNDEVWDWNPGMLAEAWGRTEAFPDTCKILNISQGGDEGTDWDEVYSRGRRYEWGMKCFKCGFHQPLAFASQMIANEDERAGVVFDKIQQSDGRFDIARCAETARFRCRKCGHDHDDEPKTWDRINHTGDYICIDPDRSMTNCSIHWEQLVNGRYGRLVTEFLTALEIKEQGSVEALRKFQMKKRALMWSMSQAVDKIEIVTAGYLKEPASGKDYKAPAGLLSEFAQTFITADFQEGRGNDSRHFKIVVRGWRDDGTSRLIWEGRLNSVEHIHQLQRNLRLRPRCVCLDGGHERNQIASWCAQYGWTVLIGDDPATFPHKSKKKGEKPIQRPYSPRFRIDPQRGRSGANRTFAFAFYWSNPSIKTVTWNLRHGKPERWELPDDLSKEYKHEIDSEVRKREIVKKSGAPRYIWYQFKKDNHAWDCECMQTTCAIMAAIVPFDVEPESEEPDESDRDSAQAPKGKRGEKAPHEQDKQLTLLET